MARPVNPIVYLQVPMGKLLSGLQLAEATVRSGYLVYYLPLGAATAVLWVARRSRRLARREQGSVMRAHNTPGWVCWWNPRIGAWYYEFTDLVAA